MKLTIQSSIIRGEFRCVRAVAVIAKSKKKGIPRRFQKTWTNRTCRPDVAMEELKPAIEAAAARWEATVMEKIKNGEKPKAVDGELIPA